MEVVASLSQGRTAAAQCGLFTYKSVPVIFEPPCTMYYIVCVMSGFRREVAENFAFLGHYATSSGNFLPTFPYNLYVLSSGFENPQKIRTLRMGPIGCPETSVGKYHYSLCNNIKERSSKEL